jgi:hypothetical protein
MAFNVETFRQHFTKNDEVAKMDHFEVWITPPPFFLLNPTATAITGIDGGSITRGFSLQAESAELPGRTLNTIEPKIYGVPYRTPATTSYSDITITFISTGTFWERKFFDAWMEFIQPKDTFDFNYRDNYVSSISVKQFSGFDPVNPIYQVDLMEAYPTSVAPQGLSWADESIHKLQVAFSYIKWSSSTPSQTTQPPINTGIPLDPTQAMNGLGPLISQGAGAIASGIGSALGININSQQSTTLVSGITSGLTGLI